MTGPVVLRVALSVPVQALFDYLPPPGSDAGSLQRGTRLLVPFGRSKRVGILHALATDSRVPVDKLKPVLEILDPGPLHSSAQMDYLQWVADYYRHPVGEVLLAALPVRLRKAEKALPPGLPGWQLTAKGESLDIVELKRAPRQVALLQLLRACGGRADKVFLRAELAGCHSIARILQDKGLVSPCHILAQSGPTETPVAPFELSAEQRQAVNAVEDSLDSFGVFLLDGVTGSGKTEVYLRLAQRVLDAGKSILLLVPEISLTPQLLRRLAERLPTRLVMLHSRMSEREREESWHLARLGTARVVIGTRSAVLAPMDRLGLVVVDEEHDTSYKQQEGFRYSARDLAVVRAKRADCPVVLGSATPSLESLRNAREGRSKHLFLRERAAGASTPRLELVDVRDQRLKSGLSTVLLREITETLKKGRQAMLFLNRRGFAPVLTCYACGWLSDCQRCDARQTLHAASGILWCHHCGSQRRVPRICPHCGAADLHPLGQGTEQLEEVLKEQFPTYPLVRIDRDATRRKGSLDKLLKQATDGSAALLVGTQMLAKGHHFPGVTLVGMLDVDGGLFGADFRAAERMAQLLMQVAGRAGRGEHPGRVLIQTRFPDHPLLQVLVREGYAAFAESALCERREAELPPYSYQALLRAQAAKAEHPARFLQEAAKLAQTCSGQVAVWGPVPAPMERRAGRFRAHLLLQASSRGVLQAFLHQYVAGLADLPAAGRVRWSLDVDPQDLQ